MESLLLQYGYLLLFLGVLVEGEVALLTAAFLAREGAFSLPAVIAVAVTANTLADLAYFTVARRRGRAWARHRFEGHERFRWLLDAVERHGFGLLLLSRFAYGLRAAIPAACGVTTMAASTFAVLDVVAGLLWAVPMALLGYRLSGALAPGIASARHYEVALGAGLLLVALLSLVARRGLRRVSRLVREGRLGARDLHRLLPLLVAFTGLVNLAVAVGLPLGDPLLASWLPVEIVERSRPLMLFSGLALLQVARSLSRRKAAGFWVASLALGVSLVSHLGHGSGAHHALAAGVLLLWLLARRRHFKARADAQSLERAVFTAPILGALVLAYGALGFLRLHADFDWTAATSPLAEAARDGLLILDPRVEPGSVVAARFLGSLQIAGWLARLYLLGLLLRPVIARTRLAAPPETVDRALRAWAQRSLQAFAVQGDKHHLLVAGGQGLVAYAVRAGVAFAAGDPLAAEGRLRESVRAFLDHCRSNGWTPCVYEASEQALPAYRAEGLRGIKMAEEAVIDLGTFSLAGGKRATLRAMVNKASRLGLAVEAYDRATSPNPATDAQLEEISREWLSGKRFGEMGFSVSRFSVASLDAVRVFVCREGERVLAFCSWREYRGGRAAVLDLMRKRTDAPSGAMDLLIARSLERLRDLGLEEASLANAPLANVQPPRGILERLASLAFARAGGLYGYRSLFQFKKKFAPRWEGRYLVYPATLDLPRVALAMGAVHGSAGLLSFVLGR